MGKDRSRGYAARARLIGAALRADDCEWRRRRAGASSPALWTQLRQGASRWPGASARRNAAAVFDCAGGFGRGARIRRAAARSVAGDRVRRRRASDRRKPRPIPMLGSSAASRFSTASSRRLPGSSASNSLTCACGVATLNPLLTQRLTRSFRAFSCSTPTLGQNDAITSGVWSLPA